MMREGTHWGCFDDDEQAASKLEIPQGVSGL